MFKLLSRIILKHKSQLKKIENKIFNLHNTNNNRNLYSTLINNGNFEENLYIKEIEAGIKRFRVYDEIDLLAADLDWSYLLNVKNLNKINENKLNRKAGGDIFKVHSLYENLKRLLSKNSFDNNQEEILNIINEMYLNAVNLPNSTHNSVAVGDYEKSECVLKIGEKITQKTPTIDQIAKLYGWFREDQISLYSTQRAYILKKELADMEVALVRYTLDYLSQKGFVLVSVPDILHHSVIESCGFPTKGERNQVYKLDYMNEYGKYCLSGTSEMSLAGLLKNRIFNENELPLKLCAVSRCYRAEVSGSEVEGRLYRLHEFTKVEMFIITLGNSELSNKMLDELKSYQIDLFSGLNLHLRVLNMSSQELGAPAHMKYDIEAWMPGNQFYGEISSTSNCSDFQSRRLHIKSTKDKSDPNEIKSFVHTLNGTACAIPRMLTCIIESNWDMANKMVHVPEKLRPYMNNRSFLKVPKDFRKVEPLKYFK